MSERAQSAWLCMLCDDVYPGNHTTHGAGMFKAELPAEQTHENLATGPGVLTATVSRSHARISHAVILVTVEIDVNKRSIALLCLTGILLNPCGTSAFEQGRSL